MKYFIIFILFWGSSTGVNANCWELAEYFYKIDGNLLRSIAIVESGMNPQARNINPNGTYDIGLMQINSIHLPRLKKMGVTEEMLISNACISVLIGSSILKDMINRYGYGWEAIGAYNAGTARKNASRRMKYARRISLVYQKQTGKQPW